MAKISAAERQRLYRQRRDADPANREIYLKKRRESYSRDIQTGKRKRINNLTQREKKEQRKLWRVNQARHRQKQQVVGAILSPPASPDEVVQAPRETELIKRQCKLKIRKCQRKIKKLQEELQAKKKKCEKYKKLIQRVKGASNADSPKEKTKAILKDQDRSSVRKTFNFHFALLADMSKRYKATKAQSIRRAYAQLFTGKLIKRYKFRIMCQQVVGFRMRRNKVKQNGNPKSNLVKTVQEFYLRDDVSRVAAGKRNTITVQTIKKQRRLLCDSMYNLHKKFVAEKGKLLSYTSFCRKRPFWVVPPSERDRDTCLCKTHENLQYMAEMLKKLGLLDDTNLEEIVKATVCNKVKECYYGDCDECKLTVYPLLRRPSDEETAVVQWSLEKIKHSKTGEDEKTSTVTVKKTTVLPEEELVSQFQDRLFKFRKHLFNIQWQYKSYRLLREQLTSRDCLIHVDFSENYNCKYANEIQSVHFGGSHKQVTLHTGVLYVQGHNPTSFCAVSPSRKHDPPAIWAYTNPVLEMVKVEFPSVENVHFFSDSPATQYRQKGNFYLLSTEPSLKGFDNVTWSFFEASHGKGAPDGVGGSLKRLADTLVRQGRDIQDAEAFYRSVQQSGTAIKLFYVTEDEVKALSERMEKKHLPTVKGTMNIHQVVSVRPGVIKYRDVSCFCQLQNGKWDCPCFELKEVSFLEEIVQEKQPQEMNGSVPSRPDVIENHHCGEWCMVSYDEELYPGIILDIEEHKVMVKCMHKNGINKFYWPCPREDINWYNDSQIVCFIPEPLPLNRRSHQIEPDIWRYLENHP